MLMKWYRVTQFKEEKCMQVLKIIFGELNRGVKYLLCVINFFVEYTSVYPFKDKKAQAVLVGFIEILNETKRKPNKLVFNQGKELYNSLM